ncbi:hypothetical protein V6N12_017249 [Hibiscus sabdariffa]|uniref:Uncharacterized protein n=1 Tax=Hibiscus sabdariffa TaxID=183260 RepID=A0ABR2CEX4_9ROSI
MQENFSNHHQNWHDEGFYDVNLLVCSNFHVFSAIMSKWNQDPNLVFNPLCSFHLLLSLKQTYNLVWDTVTLPTNRSFRKSFSRFAPMTESWRLSFKSHRKTSIQILQMLSYSQHNKVFNLPSIAMEKAETEVKQKRVPPKRGEIKIRIISIIMEFVLRVASKACSGSQRKKKVALEEMQLQKTR